MELQNLNIKPVHLQIIEIFASGTYDLHNLDSKIGLDVKETESEKIQNKSNDTQGARGHIRGTGLTSSLPENTRLVEPSSKVKNHTIVSLTSSSSSSSSSGSSSPIASVLADGRAESPPTLLAKPESCPYLPQYYLSLLSEGDSPPQTRIYSEKDLVKSFSTISRGLNLNSKKEDDWQERLNALISLQGLTLGDGPAFESFMQHIKNCHELIAAQISDLRSVISKEACRTVAFIARELGSTFAPLAELWLPTLLKQIVVKIQVISSSADKCIRIVLSSGNDVSGSSYSKVLALIMESCRAKTAILRKYGFEYLSLMAAQWKLETLEKSLPQIKDQLKAGVADADASARKTARQLFWILRGRPPWQNQMDAFLQTLDASTQKHVASEMQSPSTDLIQILGLGKKTTTILDSHDVNSTSNIATSSSEATAAESNQKNRTKTNTRSVSASGSRRKSLDFSTNLHAKSPDSHSLSDVQAASQGLQVTTAKSNKFLTLSGPVRINQSIHAQQGQGFDRMRVEDEGSTKIMPTEPRFHTSHELQSTMVARVTSTTMPIRNPTSHHAERLVTKEETLSGGSKLVDGPKRIVSKPQTQAHHSTSTVQHNFTPSNTTVQSTSSNSVEGNVQKTNNNINAPILDSKENDGVAYKLIIDELQNKCEDGLWSVRLRAFETISKLMSSNKCPQTGLEVLIDLCTLHLVDSHPKVANEALQALIYCVEVHADSFIQPTTCKLAPLMLALFQRLIDHREQIKDSSNAFLTKLKTIYDPLTLTQILAPRIGEVPERIRSAVLQFLCGCVPHCSSYFSNAQLSRAFLGRLANLLGTTGVKGNTSLETGKRLLELVYNTAPSNICAQISTLPLQQQLLLKKLLSSSVPDIDNLISTVGKTEWNNSSGPTTHDKRNVALLRGFPHHQQKSQDKDENASQCLPHPESLGKATNALPPNPPATKYNTRDIIWLLDALRPDANAADKAEAINDLRILCRSGTDEYWKNSCAQILSILLEAFNPALFKRSVESPDGRVPSSTGGALTCAANDMSASKFKKDVPIALTGLSPSPIYQQHDFGTQKGSNMGNSENEFYNNTPMTNQSNKGVPLLTAENTDGSRRYFETLHLSCKALLLLVRHKGAYVKLFMDLLVTRLCEAASFAPAAVTLQSEQILCDLAALNPHRFLKLILPYTTDVLIDGMDGYKGISPHIRLLALHSLCPAVKHLTSPLLLDELPSLVKCVTLSLSSSLVDLRKAAIFVLVEVRVMKY